jgi:hypothetical protein
VLREGSLSPPCPVLGGVYFSGYPVLRAGSLSPPYPEPGGVYSPENPVLRAGSLSPPCPEPGGVYSPENPVLRAGFKSVIGHSTIDKALHFHSLLWCNRIRKVASSEQKTLKVIFLKVVYIPGPRYCFPLSCGQAVGPVFAGANNSAGPLPFRPQLTIDGFSSHQIDLS